MWSNIWLGSCTDDAWRYWVSAWTWVDNKKYLGNKCSGAEKLEWYSRLEDCLNIVGLASLVGRRWGQVIVWVVLCSTFRGGFKSEEEI